MPYRFKNEVFSSHGQLFVEIQMFENDDLFRTYLFTTTSVEEGIKIIEKIMNELKAILPDLEPESTFYADDNIKGENE